MLRLDGETLEFQSTPPVWGATSLNPKYADIVIISIHAPRVGGDDLSDFF